MTRPVTAIDRERQIDEILRELQQLAVEIHGLALRRDELTRRLHALEGRSA